MCLDRFAAADAVDVLAGLQMLMTPPFALARLGRAPFRYSHVRNSLLGTANPWMKINLLSLVITAPLDNARLRRHGILHAQLLGAQPVLTFVARAQQLRGSNSALSRFPRHAILPAERLSDPAGSEYLTCGLELFRFRDHAMVPARMLILCVAALAGLAGCMQKPAALNHVSGKVYYKGALLRTGVVVFTPDALRGESGKVAVGTIAADGTYTVATEDGPGAPAGWYRVTIGALTGASPTFDTIPISLIPDKYRDPANSQLQCEVVANRDNNLVFNLD
jgi:hypothetical protein